MEVVFAFFFLAVLIGLGAVGFAVVQKARTTQLGRGAPLSSASQAGATEQAKHYYRLLQRSVRIMDGLVSDDMTRVVIPNSVQEQIQAISKKFYDL